MLKNTVGAEAAHQQTIEAYHSLLEEAYLNTFNDSMPSKKDACATMTENLALRTIHDLLPGNIEVDGIITPVLDPSLIGKTLSESDMNQKSAELDGQFDPEFLNIHIIIPPDVDIIINLLERDSSFADQFGTDFSFEYFMSEISDGSFDSGEEVMDQIQNLFAKGLGAGCFVGGTLVPVSMTSLLIAGITTNTLLIVLVVGAIAAGVVIFFKSRNKF